MAASAAVVSLLQIVDSLLQSTARGCRISFNTAQLKSLHEKVSFLLEFLCNSSPNYGEREDLEQKIMLAAYKVEDAIVSAISKQLTAEPGVVKQGDGIAHPHFLLNLVAPPLGRVKVKAQILNSVMCVLPISLQFILNLCFQIVIFFPFCTLLYLSYFTVLIVNPIASVIIYEVHKLAVRGISFATIYWRYVYQPRIRDLDVAMIDFNFIMEEVIEIKDASGSGQDLESLQSADCLSEGIGKNVDTANALSLGKGMNVVVGLDSDLIEILDRLTRESPGREIMSIVGMGGIGKTTLARRVHDHAYIVDHFDVRYWVAVSQEHSLRRIMLDLLASANIGTEEILQKHRDDDDGLDRELGVYLHKNLMGRRYLLVMDDVWDMNDLDSVITLFPDEGNGSRVLLTTRLSQVASYANPDIPPLHISVLNDDDSWDLLCKKAFGGEDCPTELEAIGRKIARNCRGLPLAIVVVGSLLYDEHRTEGVWMRVLNDLHSIMSEDDEQCLEILGLSYNHLPHHLKPCFLYMGAFLGAMEIPATKLFNLWAAEGFLIPSESESLEQVAEEYINDLVQRNLVLIGKQSCNGNIITYKMHDLLRDFCLLNARKEKFLDFTSLDGNIGHGSGCRLVRVLQLDKQHGFPDEFLLKSVHLRCLVLTHAHWPSPISRLWSLQTLVFHHDMPMIPAEIWLLPNLRHLYLKRGQLPDPPGCQLLCNTVLENLQTLVGVWNFKLTKGILKRIPNLKKLCVSYEFPGWDRPEYYFESLANLSGLHQLERLKIAVRSNSSKRVAMHPPKLAFPEKLKELSLSACRFPWENMTTVGALPNLEVLKLKDKAFVGENWEVVEGEFSELKFLLIDVTDLEHWIADETPFPRLHCLILRRCKKLQEIPCSIGYIPTLERIELIDCHSSAVASAEQIQEEQQDMGNEDLKIHVKNHGMRRR